MPAADKKFRVRIKAVDEEALSALPMDQIDRGCTGGVRKLPDGSFELEAIVTEPVLKRIEKGKRVKAEVLADLEEEGKRKRKQVGRGNRFEGEHWIPRGLGKKTREGGER